MVVTESGKFNVFIDSQYSNALSSIEWKPSSILTDLRELQSIKDFFPILSIEEGMFNSVMSAFANARSLT